MTTPTNPAPPTAVERVFNSFQRFTADVFESVGEAKSLVLVVDWNTGKNDFPAGLLITREKAVKPTDLIDMCSQMLKMSGRLLKLHGENLVEVIKLRDALTEEITNKQKLYNELQAEIAKLEQHPGSNDIPPTTAGTP